jgi:hypothetical protein
VDLRKGLREVTRAAAPELPGYQPDRKAFVGEQRFPRRIHFHVRQKGVGRFRQF